MPLIICPDCSREISSSAKLCIGCGRPLESDPISVSGISAAAEPKATTPGFRKKPRELAYGVIFALAGMFSVFLLHTGQHSAAREAYSHIASSSFDGYSQFKTRYSSKSQMLDALHISAMAADLFHDPLAADPSTVEASNQVRLIMNRTPLVASAMRSVDRSWWAWLVAFGVIWFFVAWAFIWFLSEKRGNNSLNRGNRSVGAERFLGM